MGMRVTDLSCKEVICVGDGARLGYVSDVEAFMGESAKILNPDKKVIMPNLSADCPMAHMVAPGKIEDHRKAYGDNYTIESSL